METPITKNVYQVILAEDDAVNADFIVAALNRYNFKVRVANDGCAAVKYLEESAFDLFICDIMMPYLDGLKLLETVRTRETPLPPTLMLTALSDHETVAKARALGAQGYLIKPATAAQLIAKARAVMGLQERGLVDKATKPFAVNTDVSGNTLVIVLTGCPMRNPQSDLIKAVSAAMAVRSQYAAAQIQVGRDLIYDAEPFGTLTAMAQYLQRTPGIGQQAIQFTGSFFGSADQAELQAFQARYSVKL